MAQPPRKQDAFECAVLCAIAELKLELEACKDSLIETDLNTHFDLYVNDLLETIEIPEKIKKLEFLLKEWRWTIYGEYESEASGKEGTQNHDRGQHPAGTAEKSAVL